MPGWEFDRKTCTMVPKKATGLEFHMVNGGLKVIDNDLGTSFIILRSNDSIGYAQGIAGTRGVKLYDYNKAQRIAERVKRCLPTSQYTDYRKFCRGVSENQMSDEDKALLETLVNGYKGNSLNEALNELDYSIGVHNPKASDLQTKGATDYHGVSGLIKSLPSALISFIICPPLAIIKLLGAVRIRTEKRWLKTMFNTNTWTDFIAMPNEKKEELKKKMEDKLTERTQYYYSELANGEILKVPACSKLEARDMILAIERKDIERRYAEYNQRYSHRENGRLVHGIYTTGGEVQNNQNNDNQENHGNNTSYFHSGLYIDEDNECKMWVVKFNDGQACYAFGPEGQRDQIMKEAEENKKSIVDYYKQIVLKSRNGDDNDSDKKMKHLAIGKENNKNGTMSGDYDEIDELFTPPKVDDMEEIKNISMYSPITEDNEKDFSEPSTSPIQWKSKKYPSYVINFGQTQERANPYMISFNIPASKDDEVSLIMQSTINGLNDYIQKETNTIEEIVRENSEYRGVVLRYTINKSTFNIVCIDDRPQRQENGNDENNRNQRERIQIDNSRLISVSNVENCLRTIRDALRTAYANSELERGLRNEYSSNYENNPSREGVYEYDRNNPQVNWNTVWENVITQMNANETQAQLVRQSGGENIRRNVQIRLRAAA